jgi:L-cysteine desulfidase
MITFLEEKKIEVRRLDSGFTFDLIITVYSQYSEVSVRISHFHTNIVSITRDGKVIYQSPHCDEVDSDEQHDRSILSVETSIDFAETV